MSNNAQLQDDGNDGGPASETGPTETPRGRLIRLKINRFRHVKAGTELRFDGGINVLLGRNGTGKTTLLELISAVASGSLSTYKKEAFDLEFEVLLGDVSFTTSVQNSLSIAEALIGSATKRNFWKYCVALSGPLGETATATVAPRSAKITLHGESANGVQVEEVSPFVSFFYVLQFAQNPKTIDVLNNQGIADLLPSLLQNCLRLDEGLDIFRAAVGGEPLGLFGLPLSISVGSSLSAANIAEFAWYIPRVLVSHILRQGSLLHEATEIKLNHAELGFLKPFTDAINATNVRFTMSLLNREQGGTSTFGKPSFLITTHSGTTFTHDKLSYGEKRLLAFLYHAAANPQILVADELVNGLHHEWIQACLDAIQGQAFLTSQNPLLLDHLPFSSGEEAQRRFVLCDRNEQGEWTWRNMDQDAADAFYRAYEVGVQHVSGILRTKGLW